MYGRRCARRCGKEYFRRYLGGPLRLSVFAKPREVGKVEVKHREEERRQGVYERFVSARSSKKPRNKDLHYLKVTKL